MKPATFNTPDLNRLTGLVIGLAALLGVNAPRLAHADQAFVLENMPSLRLAAGARPMGPGIWLQKGLPGEQVDLLQRDIQVLKTMEISPANAGPIRAILGISSATPGTLNEWLEQRVQAVVGEDFDIGSHAVALSAKRPLFENAGILPTIENSTIKPTGKSVTVMSNIGVGAYYVAKINQSALGLRIPGVGTIRITSPRAGIIKIGEGLFTGRRVLTPEQPLARANSIPRLATFLHEARHSDGNGKSLGFLHAVCPAGHVLGGYNACDRNLNGPYTVGAVTLRGMAESCKDCTADQREKLRLQYIDSFGRVLALQLDGKTATVALDARPEGKRE